MKFLHPEFIYLMLLPAAVLVYLIMTNKSTLERVFTHRTLEALRIEGDALGRQGHNTLLFFAFSMMTLALARPVIEKGSIPLAGGCERGGVVFAVPLFKKGYEEVAVHIADLIDRSGWREVAVGAFGKAPYIALLPTIDKEAAVRILLGARKGVKSVDAVDARAFMKLLRTLGLERHEVLVVAPPVELTHLDEALNERGKGAPIRLAVWVTAKDGDTLENWKRLAKSFNGLYVEGEWSRVFVSLIGWVDGGCLKHAKTRNLKRYVELFYYPLFLALLALPFALFSPPKRGLMGVISILAAVMPAPSWAGLDDFLLIDEAMAAYRQGGYEKSIEALERLTLRNGRPEVWYDLGNAYYRAGRFAMACRAYANVVTADPKLESAKLYNLGNCYARLGRWRKAAAFYEKVLTIWDDPDARYNLKLVRQMAAVSKKGPIETGAKTGFKIVNRGGSDRKRGVGEENRTKAPFADAYELRLYRWFPKADQSQQ